MARPERVTTVIDGDTFRTKSRKNSVRLANVDAPELGQRGAVAATKHLKKLVRGKTVTVQTVARDPYGRTIAKVKSDGKSVNAAMKKYLKGETSQRPQNPAA